MVLVGERLGDGVVVVHILDRREDQLRLLVVNGEGNLLEGLLFARVEGKVFREILVGNNLKAEVGHGHLDVSQFQRQHVHVPRGQFADLVVREDVYKRQHPA